MFKGLSLVKSIQKIKENNKFVLSEDEVLKWNDFRKDMLGMVYIQASCMTSYTLYFTNK